jgi:hypothetical protein
MDKERSPRDQSITCLKSGKSGPSYMFYHLDDQFEGTILRQGCSRCGERLVVLLCFRMTVWDPEVGYNFVAVCPDCLPEFCKTLTDERG